MYIYSQTKTTYILIFIKNIKFGDFILFFKKILYILKI